MWKKIRSSRDPNDTLFSEVRKEFSPYFEKAGNSFSIVLQKAPKSFFVFMVILLVVSIALTFTVFRHPEPKTKPVTAIHPLNDGFDQILRAGAQLKETIRLKKMVDSISAKTKLSATDSTGLVQALDSLQKIHPSIK